MESSGLRLPSATPDVGVDHQGCDEKSQRDHGTQGDLVRSVHHSRPLARPAHGVLKSRALFDADPATNADYVFLRAPAVAVPLATWFVSSSVAGSSVFSAGLGGGQPVSEPCGGVGAGDNFASSSGFAASAYSLS